MSMYICTRCNRFHDSIQAMKACKHIDEVKPQEAKDEAVTESKPEAEEPVKAAVRKRPAAKAK